jgi:ABC-type multidrug transport system fused ATPase/permease subunit
VIDAVQLFPKTVQIRILAVAVIQISVGLLDLAGVAAMGLLGALAVTGVQSRGPGNRVENALELLHLTDFSFQSQALFIALIAVTLLVGRTLLSIYFTKKSLNFLAIQGAQLSEVLLSRLLRERNIAVRSSSTQNMIYSLTSGVIAVTLGLIASAIAILADFSLLIILFIGLLIVDPILSILTVVAFSLVGYLLFRFSHTESALLGKSESDLSIMQNTKISELISLYREILVLNLRGEFADGISQLQQSSARTTARLNFIPFIGKYVIEASMIIIAIGIAGIQFLTSDAVHAVSAMTVFMAAGSRIAPSILRLQQSAINIKRSAGQAEPTFQLIKSMPIQGIIQAQLISKTSDFVPNVSIVSLSFAYPNRAELALSNINLEIRAGEHVALVGPSGSGKSTLVDSILGVLEPKSGQVKISDLNPRDVYEIWPGAVAYVPQTVVMRAGTLRSNLILTEDHSKYSDEHIMDVLNKLKLETLLASLPNGLDSPIYEGGKNLSGGQKQRIGVARALIPRPQLLILDEATSALDSQTESEIAQVFNNLSGEVTLISIAHRLSTVRAADRVVYIDQGKISALGSFDEVRKQIKDFDEQARLLGLE